MAMTDTSRGWGPFRVVWMSICSAHRDKREWCRLCSIGRWSWVVPVWLDQLAFRISLALWRKWKNR